MKLDPYFAATYSISLILRVVTRVFLHAMQIVADDSYII